MGGEYMTLSKRMAGPVARALAVSGVVLALVVGVTYAALQSQATLTDNTISSATADLNVRSTNPNFVDSAPGFDFEGVVPGGPMVPEVGEDFELENDTAEADMKLFVSIDGVPTVTTAPDADGDLDWDKVYLVIERVDTGETNMFSFTELTDGSSNMLTDMLAADTFEAYKAYVKMDTDAIVGEGSYESVGVGEFDIIFTGELAGSEATPTPEGTVTPTPTPTATPDPTEEPSPTVSPSA